MTGTYDSGLGYTRRCRVVVLAATHCHLFPGRGRQCSLTSDRHEDRTGVDAAWEVVARWLEPGMTGQLQTQLGGLTATRTFRDGKAHDGMSSAVDLSNVIPFTRARRAGTEPYAPPVTINPADRPAPLVPGRGAWLQALLLLISLIAHSSLFYLFWQEPQPLLGIGT